MAEQGADAGEDKYKGHKRPHELIPAYIKDKEKIDVSVVGKPDNAVTEAQNTAALLIARACIEPDLHGQGAEANSSCAKSAAVHPIAGYGMQHLSFLARRTATFPHCKLHKQVPLSPSP